MNRFKLLAATLAIFGIAHAAEQNPTDVALTLVDMQGQKQVLGILPNTIFAPRVSPDGTRVSFELTDAPVTPGAPPLVRPYVAELGKVDKRRPLQATLTAPKNYATAWSPGSDWIAFVGSGNGSEGIFIQRADGSIQPKYLVEGRAPEGLYDGDLLAFITLKGEHDYGISLLNLNTKTLSRIDLPGTAQHSSRIAPNGRWIAYASDETGRQEVWLEPLPLTGKRHQLTRQGGRHPLWSPDGATLYFDQDGKLFRMAVSFNQETPQSSDPALLPIAGFLQGDARRQYDLTPDGKAFVMLFPVGAVK